MLRNNSRLMKCFKCQLKCAGNREGNLSHFPSAMTPREIMANQKWSKWSTWSRDHETIRTCAENAVDVFSCLVFAAPALKSSPPRAPICAIWAPWSCQVLFWSSFDIFWTSFGHSVCPSYVILCRLTSSYVILRLFASNNGPVDLVCPLPSLYLSSQHFTDFTSVWF